MTIQVGDWVRLQHWLHGYPVRQVSAIGINYIVVRTASGPMRYHRSRILEVLAPAKEAP